MKSCKKCSVEKPLFNFYVHKAMSDGYLNICKQCTKARISSHREQNIERIKAYDRSRGMIPKRVEARKQYAKTDAGKVAIKKAVKNYRARHTDRYFAHTAVANAIRDGRLIKYPCFICGDVMSQGHHSDYTRPLDVVWLCEKHHKQAHALTKEKI